MKSFTSAIILALAAAASAAPSRHSKRQDPTCIVQTVVGADTTAVAASINQWFADVNAVNAFLNTALTLDPTTLQSHAQAALLNAQDEPCQLMTLTSTSDLGSDVTDAFECAGQDLMRVFGDHVITNLNTIIAAPNNTVAVTAAVDDINDFRCCNVLSDASILWLDNAADNGLVGTVPTQAPPEDACAGITCTQACTGLDNGSFGTVSGP
ncbi:uncharacterized protein LTR77_001998 [Saxophila tyrrhenica]|uniref:FAS1 domain-containing protein n=1 Tax=Saxophila tyrrhenica TaxID=1690608 RepID=A0AAV9PHA6_9PEZI|nr:hypothetical protein LTR77_001998 [Saxophila tyrrhenica]